MKKRTIWMTLITMVIAATLIGCSSDAGISAADSATDAEQSWSDAAEDEAVETVEDENNTAVSPAHEAREIVSYGGNSVNGRIQGYGDACIGDGNIYFITDHDNSGNSALCRIDLDGNNYAELLSFSDYKTVGNLNYYNGSIYYSFKNDGSTTTELRCLDGADDSLIAEFEGSLKLQNFNDDLFYINRDETEIRVGVFSLSSGDQNLFYTGAANGSLTDLIDTDGTYIYIYLYTNNDYGIQSIHPYRIQWDSIYDETAALEEICIDSLGYTPICGDNGFYTVKREEAEDGETCTNFVYYDYADIVSGDSGLEWTPDVVLQDVETDWTDDEKVVETLFWTGNFKFILDDHFICIDADRNKVYYSDSLDYRLSTCIDDNFYSDMESHLDLCLFEYDNMVYFFNRNCGDAGTTIHHIDADGNIDS